MGKKGITIRNKNTGFIFDGLTEEAVKSLKDSDREDIFEVLDKDFKLEEPTEKIPVNADNVLKGNFDELEKLKIEELRAFCAENEIDIKGLKSKADIIARIKGE